MRKLVLIAIIIFGGYYLVKNLTQSRIDRIIDSHPEWKWTIPLEYYLGEFYSIFGKWEKAIHRFERIVKKYPDDLKWAPRAQYALAKTYDDSGNKKKAIEEYQKLIDSYPESDYFDIAKKRITVLR
ncbi:MAG: tetratricopeptide repeat protein [Endomicrobiia bacterium]